MAQLHVLMGADTVRARPTVRTIGLADLKDALARGLADFSAIPTHAVFLCLIYPIVGLVRALAALVSARRRLRAGRPVRSHRLLRAEPAPRAGSRHILGRRLR